MFISVTLVALGGALMGMTLQAADTEIKFHNPAPGIPLMMVPVKVNGQGPYDFIVDTGNAAQPIILTPELAKTLGIKTHSETTKTGFPIGLSKTLDVGSIDRFQLGNLDGGPYVVGVSPAMSELSARLPGSKIDGNIGYGFFKDYTLTLDYQNSTLGLRKKPAVGDLVPFRIGESKPLIIVDVLANGKPFHFALDTGASACCVSNELATSLSLAKGQEFHLNKSKGDLAYLSSLGTLKVGGSEQKGITVAVVGFLTDLSKACGEQIDGVIGHNFLNKFKVTIDYPRHKLVFGAANGGGQ